MREALETFFLPCHNEHCRFSKHFGISPGYIFSFCILQICHSEINQLHLRGCAKKRGEGKESLPGDDKLWKFHRLLSDGLIVNHCLDFFVLTFRCMNSMNSKDGVWNFALMKPSGKQHCIYWDHFLSISGNSGHSKKDDIEERCQKIMVEKAEKKEAPSGTLLL